MKSLISKYNLAEYFTYFVIVIFLSPLLITGYAGDDIYNSQIYGLLIENNQTFFNRILEQIHGWMSDSGRLFIFNYFLIYQFHLYFDNPLYVRIVQLVIIVLTIYLFNLIVGKFTKTSKANIALIFIVLAHFQFRNWHDPFLIFPSHLVIILALLLFLSKYFFMLHVDNKNWFYLFLSSISYFIAIFTYEIAVPLILIFFIYPVFKGYKLRRLLYESRYHLSIFIFYLLVFLIVKFIYQNNNEGYQTFSEFNFLGFGKALFIQLLSTIPISSISILSNFNAVLFFVIFIFLFFFLNFYYKNNNQENFFSSQTSKGLFYLGSFLVLIPACLASISGHQHEIIQTGYGYSPVYFQYFGSSIFILLLFNYILNKFKIFEFNKKRFIYIFLFSFFISLSLSLNIINNYKISNIVNYIDKHPRNILQNAFANNLFSGLSENSSLIRIMKKGVDWKWFYFSKTGFSFKICDFLSQDYKNHNEPLKPLNDCFNFNNLNEVNDVFVSKPHDLWVTSYFINNDDPSNAYIFLSKIDKIVFDKNMDVLLLDPEYSLIYDNKSQKISRSSQKIDVLALLNNESLNLTSDIDFENMFQFRDDKPLININGLLPREGSIGSYLNWVNDDFHISFHNYKNSNNKIVLNAEIINLNNEDFNIFISTPNSTETFQVLSDRINVINYEYLLSDDENILSITTDAKVFKNGDPRMIKFGLKNFKINFK